MPIQVNTGSAGMGQMKAAFRKNWIHYLQEAIGLAIFMASACFFSAMLFSGQSSWQTLFPNIATRYLLMGLLMGATALFIFYSPVTSPSGSHINPAVTLAFLRLNKICRYDAMFFIIAQFIGGTAAVYGMERLLGPMLTHPPVSFAATTPGSAGSIVALLVELVIAFITMHMVLLTSGDKEWKRYTRIISAALVCCWVILAGPVSGFGMNPARSFASALPSGIWTSFWIYLAAPVAGMLAATEVFLQCNRKAESEPGISSISN